VVDGVKGDRGMTSEPQAAQPEQGVRVRQIALRLTDGLVPLLALLAEGAWIAVAAAFLQAAAHEPAWLGPAGYALFAALGWFAARRAGPSRGLAFAAPLLVVAGALLGWLASPHVLGELATGQPAAALAQHPAGWLGGLAVLRGVAHARSPSSEAALGSLVAVAIPALAIPLLVGGFIPEPGREAFLEQATPATVVFLVSATLGLAITRMAAIGNRSGFDWRRNRAWLVVLSLLVGVVALVSVPSSGWVALAVQVLVGVLLVPAFVLGLIASVVRITRRTLVNLAIILAMGAVLFILLQPDTIRPINIGIGAAGGEAPIESGGVYLVMGIALLVGLALVVVLLVWLWMHQSPGRGDADVPEERMIDRGDTTNSPSTARRHRGRGGARTADPTTAAGAYVALLRDLAPSQAVGREPGETPTAHARRLRTAGFGGVRLELLAADYELDRWGERHLTNAEERRGVARWRRLRRELGRIRHEGRVGDRW
jgi:hypothetical protein